MLYTTDAIVLRHANYGDYDRMVTLMSPTLGRIDAIARGSRRPKSALLGATEVFSVGQFTINTTAERHSITQAAISESYYDLRGDYDRLVGAMYCLSLADAAALPGQSCEDIFVLLLKALAHLCYSDLPVALLTACFEMRYMPLMGYRPRMERCVECGKALEGDARFDAARGGVLCDDCGRGLPRITRGARRIIWRAPQTDYATAPRLLGHADWPLAARLYRPFVLERIDRRFAVTPPPIPDGDDAADNDLTPGETI